MDSDYSGIGGLEEGLQQLRLALMERTPGSDFPSLIVHSASDVSPHCQQALLLREDVQHIWGHLSDKLPERARQGFDEFMPGSDECPEARKTKMRKADAYLARRLKLIAANREKIQAWGPSSLLSK